MTGTSAATRSTLRPAEPAARSAAPEPGRDELGPPRLRAAPERRPPLIGVIHNLRARHNLGRAAPPPTPGCDQVTPATHAELGEVLAGFVAAGIDTLIVDGGDGTVRDVLSAIVRDFRGFRPRIAIVPSGKTNALATDLGIRRGWTLGQAIAAIAQAHTVERFPIEVWRGDADRADAAGFMFGGGAYVRATRMAQRTHRVGAFNGLAVGLSIGVGVGQTVLAGPRNSWRSGEPMRIGVDDDPPVDAPHYLLLASTLHRLPLGIRPFGPVRSGLKMLRIEAPARRLAWAAPVILAGGDRRWWSRHGYHRRDARRIDVSLGGGFVLDGETFAGGDLTLRRGAPFSFVVP